MHLQNCIAAAVETSPPGEHVLALDHAPCYVYPHLLIWHGEVEVHRESRSTEVLGSESCRYMDDLIARAVENALPSLTEEETRLIVHYNRQDAAQVAAVVAIGVAHAIREAPELAEDRGW